ncbi:peptidylprolyl isomerase [Rubritalea marina]|uniref:peptidylprolyl isomerase n=1 Tax=Rubritalea marina TaxID=361055 RepID=UPI00035EE568|nr:SurA N-terminal domain-containing protein [Rubritalea marina]
MKHLISILIPLVLSAALASAIELNGIAAKINGRVVTKNEVAFALAPIRSYLATKYPRKTPTYFKELEEARNNILNELIERELVLYEFNDIGAQIPEHIIDSEIRRKVRADYNNNVNLFREELQSKGLSFKKYRELIHRQLIVQAMRAQQFSDTPPATPEELRQEYKKMSQELRDTSKDQCDFQKIYIPKIDEDNLLSTPENQLEITESIVAQLKDGADFAELALEYSKDAWADEGGLHTEVQRVDLSPVIATMIFEEPTGTVLGPLEDAGGFHIIVVNKKVLGPSPALSDPEVRNLVRRNVEREKSSARYQRWITDLKRKAMIVRKM